MIQYVLLKTFSTNKCLKGFGVGWVVGILKNSSLNLNVLELNQICAFSLYPVVYN